MFIHMGSSLNSGPFLWDPIYKRAVLFRGPTKRPSFRELPTCLRVWGLGYRGLRGFGVSGLGFRVWGFGVQGLV